MEYRQWRPLSDRPRMSDDKTYHIYLEDRCLFKNLNEWEFNIIWRRIYHAYFKEEISYSVVGPSENPKKYEESSY